MKLSSALLGLSSFAAAINWSHLNIRWVADTWLAKTFMKKLMDIGEDLNFDERILTEFPAAVAAVDQSFFEPAWNFFNENGDDVIATDDFSSSEKRITDFLMGSFGFSNGDQIVYYYLEVVDDLLEFTDYDRSWDLSFDEWRDTQAIVAAAFSLVILEAFDVDENGFIDSAELRSWPSTVQTMMVGYDLQLNASHLAAISAAWAKSQTDEDPFSASKMELARFTILMWNSFLELI